MLKSVLLHSHTSLEPGSPLAHTNISTCKEGESLESFDHVLDVVGRSYQLVVNFAHVHRFDSVQ